MRARIIVGVLALLAAVLVAPAPAPAEADAVSVSVGAVPACAGARGLVVSCFAQVLTTTTVRRTARGTSRTTSASTGAPRGLGPADIRSAYGLPYWPRSGETVAVVTAMDDRGAESDLATYRAHFGLPACTTATRCLRIADQNGGTSRPAADTGWAIETSLDLDAVSAACPGCHILLVEARSAQLADMGTAVVTAVRLGATVVSNSWGVGEFSGQDAWGQAYFVHPRVPIVAASGDDGAGHVDFPASLVTSVAVGGTTLDRVPWTWRGWSESAWRSGSSGCSAYVAKPRWQTDRGCPRRTVVDVSADADPTTGLAFYDSGYGGWLVGGGTSVAAPLVASMIALSGNASGWWSASRLYRYPSSLHDVVGGANGFCWPLYLCSAGFGYDAPTGEGTPAGLGAV